MNVLIIPSLVSLPHTPFLLSSPHFCPYLFCSVLLLCVCPPGSSLRVFGSMGRCLFTGARGYSTEENALLPPSASNLTGAGEGRPVSWAGFNLYCPPWEPLRPLADRPSFPLLLSLLLLRWLCLGRDILHPPVPAQALLLDLSSSSGPRVQPPGQSPGQDHPKTRRVAPSHCPVHRPTWDVGYRIHPQDVPSHFPSCSPVHGPSSFPTNPGNVSLGGEGAETQL